MQIGVIFRVSLESVNKASRSAYLSSVGVARRSTATAADANAEAESN